MPTGKPLFIQIKTEKESAIHLLAHLRLESDKAEHLAHQNVGNIQSISDRLELTRVQLHEIIRENVLQLCQCIFPICREGPVISEADENDSASLATVKDALADACQTAYVRGQWIYADTGNGQYSIAGATLPGTGDIAAYELCGKSRLTDPFQSCDLR